MSGRTDSNSHRDLLASEAEEVLEGWSEREQLLFDELLEDASSELQREYLLRSLAAGHSSRELHAFADQIRGMDDDELYAACTPLLPAAELALKKLSTRLRAEADPLFGYTVNGHSLTGDGRTDERDPLGLRRVPQSSAPVPVALLAPMTSPSYPGREPAFDEESVSLPPVRKVRTDLGGSRDSEPSFVPSLRQPRPGPLSVELFNEAVGGLGYRCHEAQVEDPRQGDRALTLSHAVDKAVAALRDGLLVPVVLGPSRGSHRRYVLMIQVASAASGHAIQLHDPVTQETVWVNEADLRVASDPPFRNKSLRRITALALPQRKGAGG